MQTKLTLRLDERLIAQAKARAQRQGKSLSQMVADYFAQFDTAATSIAMQHELPLPPLVASLQGQLRHAADPLADDGRQAYYDHLQAKHQ
ncbi:MAG: antitoxin [Proteobacteria bacterium]|nr:antitoxin [Pseudomonadota bacterium]